MKARGIIRLLAWASYDFANSIWAINVLTLYFLLWLTDDLKTPELTYSLVYSGLMLLVAVSSPLLGAVSDRYGRRMPFLIAFTLLCIVPGMLFGTAAGSSAAALALFAAATFGYMAATVFYNALLPDISSAGNRGFASGVGIGAGYLGNVLGVLLIKPFVDAGGRAAAFVPSALGFLLFALPCFLLVRDIGPRAPWSWNYVRDSYRQAVETVRQAGRYKELFKFILARFFYEDAIATFMAFISVFLTRVADFTTSELQLIVILATACALPGALLYGWVADRLGVKRTLVLVLAQWAAVFVGGITAAEKPVFFALAVLTGISLGAVGACDRVMLTRLAPPERIGEFFGLYVLVGRVAAVVGPVLWGLTLTAFAHLGTTSYRLAVLALFIVFWVGFGLLLRVREFPVPVIAPAGPAPRSTD
jgi:UMF1 family MFS transporter